MCDNWLKKICWTSDGLLQVVVQQDCSGKVLMVAWMNREALRLTVQTNEAHYWSRSRKKLWRKGEESGHVQRVKEIHLDCDGDVLLLTVEQAGGIACHTGRISCFFYRLDNDRWVISAPVIKNPDEIYSK